MKYPIQLKVLACVFALFLPLLSLSASAGDASTLQAGTHHDRVVFQVSDSIPEKWNLTLNNARNLQELVGKNNVDVEIVAYGPGIDMLRFESEVGSRIDDALNNGVKIVACENTMKSKKLTKQDMLTSIGYVPAGVVELMKKQEEGWAYIRP